jgi:hypothetical protein
VNAELHVVADAAAVLQAADHAVPVLGFGVVEIGGVVEERALRPRKESAHAQLEAAGGRRGCGKAGGQKGSGQDQSSHVPLQSGRVIAPSNQA